MCSIFVVDDGTVRASLSPEGINYGAFAQDVNSCFLTSEGRVALLKRDLYQSRREHAIVLLGAIEELQRLIKRINDNPEFAVLFDGARDVLDFHLDRLLKTFSEELQALNNSPLE